MCVILSLAIFTQYRRVMDGHTQTDRHTMMAYTGTSIALCSINCYTHLLTCFLSG